MLQTYVALVVVVIVRASGGKAVVSFKGGFSPRQSYSFFFSPLSTTVMTVFFSVKNL